ncbi:MAG: hypothetical protein ACRC37_02455 [Lentisphaeria bacterium]
MSTTIFRNKNLVRPKKTGAAKRARIKAQRNRLIGLGVDTEKVAAMTPKQIREILKRPKKVVASN